MPNGYSFEVLSSGPQYKNYLFVEGPGEVAVVPSPYSDGWAIVFTDRDTAGGVAFTPGQDNDWFNALAYYWIEKAEAGFNPGDVFDTITFKYGASRVSHYECLRDLRKVTGIGLENDE